MKATEICDVFRACFLASHNTWLKGGADEPVYLPAKNQDGFNYIYFRQDFAASALHEVSHWCIAGSIRRRQEDFGYWYDPERGIARQIEFEQFEARPQGLEWIFSVAAGLSFRVSCDNFDESILDMDRFRRQIRSATLQWLGDGLSGRAKIFAEALSARSGVTDPYDNNRYKELPK